MKPLLTLQGLSVTFGGLKAVSDLNYDLEAGMLGGLIGPNGAGKTTVFNVITGVYRPTSGAIHFDGAPIQGRATNAIAARGVARTFQNPRLFSSLSCLDNVRIACHLHGGVGLADSILASARSQREEREILARRRTRRTEEAHVAKVVTRDDLLAMQAALEDVHVDSSIEEYIVDVARATREDPRIALGASPRGSLALLRLARAAAALRRSDFVTPDDVKAMAVPALAHRMVLRPELWVSRISPADVVAEILSRVPTPAAIAP